MTGDTACPYCSGTTEQHDPDCGTLLPPIVGVLDVIDPHDELEPEGEP
jgi:hypothetical protein